MTPRADVDIDTPLLVPAHEWQRAEAALEMARSTQQALRLCEALTELGRCERRSGATDGAAVRLDEALHWARRVGSVVLLADLLCERGELAADVAIDPASPGQEPEPDAWLLARACATEAAGLAGHTSDPGWEVQVLLRASDLFNRIGNPVSAGALQLRAMIRLSRPARVEVTAAPRIESAAHPTLQ